MYYYKDNKGKIELTEHGKFTLDYLGLTLEKMKKMTGQQLTNYCKKFSDVLNTENEWKSGGSVTGNEPSLPTTNVYGEYKHRLPWQSYNDSGSFSRYFDIDAWWQERLKKLPKEVQKTFPFLVVPKASKSEKDKGTKHLSTRNDHLTVKPLTLMSYLITLGSRKNDVILDPFVGSGTVSLAAKMLSRKSIGIEINPEYVKIAKARLKSVSSLDEWL